MILVLVTAAVVAFIAVRRGGSLEALASTEFAWTSLLFVALLVQITADLWGRFTPATVEAAVLVLTYAAVAFFLALNRHLPGMLIAAVGMSLNAIVIVLNGAMPVSLWAARIAGLELKGDLGVKHEVAGPHTVLGFLGDIIPIPMTLQVVSIGDVVMAVGIALLVYRQTLRRSPQAVDAAESATRASG